MICCATARASATLSTTLTPFLYPCLDSNWTRTRKLLHVAARIPRGSSIFVPRHLKNVTRRRAQSSLATSDVDADTNTARSSPTRDVNQYDHLDPAPADYSSAPFIDACTLTVSAGAGGHGCISFLREKYIANGPPNGGDGGTGGSVYIQAIDGETSLHKLARRSILKAQRGKNGQGSLKGGARGEDVLITVPVGTVVREISRRDPLEQDEHKWSRLFGQDTKGKFPPSEGAPDEQSADQTYQWRKDKWLLYPGTLPKNLTIDDFPPLPRPRRSNLASLQPPAPLRLDLDHVMKQPILLAAGAVGGLGNPHFVSKTVLKPKYATKGDDGLRISLQLELKLLADVGLVGLPNAGKSTLLRALTKSRTRVGSWAFTTLRPNIGTVVLDNYAGRPTLDMKGGRKEPRTKFTIADIPGLIEDAHLDRGLGLGFLRHIERAAVLAFVVDLGAGDAVAAVNGLWREVVEYEQLRERELNADTERVKPTEHGMEAYQPFASSISPGFDPEKREDTDGNLLLDPAVGRQLPPLSLPPISSKPWMVIATKADLPGTQANYGALKSYLDAIQTGETEHPSGKENAWRKSLYSVPVSAINKEGVAPLSEIILRLLNE